MITSYVFRECRIHDNAIIWIQHGEAIEHLIMQLDVANVPEYAVSGFLDIVEGM